MTTKVKISVQQVHTPVAVDVLRGDGTVVRTLPPLHEAGAEIEEYVHSDQMLRVRELPPDDLPEPDAPPEEPPVEG